MRMIANFVIFGSLVVITSTLETYSIVDELQHDSLRDASHENGHSTATTVNFKGNKFILQKISKSLLLHYIWALDLEEGSESVSNFTISKGANPLINGQWMKDSMGKTQKFHSEINFLQSHHTWKLDFGSYYNNISNETFASISNSDLWSLNWKGHQITDSAENKTQVNGSVSFGNGQPILSLSFNQSLGDLGWKSHFVLKNPLLNWQISGNGTLDDKDGNREIHFNVKADYLDRPKESPLHYGCRYTQKQQSPFVDLKHKISSDFYTFEGNMTVSQGLENGSVITEIFQRTGSSVWPILTSDLRQIFHQSPDFSWESVVMKSNLVDLHVTGKWTTSIWEYYRKLFQFRSHFELLPSVNVRLTYSDKTKFLHEFHFLFLAKQVEVLVEVADSDAIFPLKLSASFQDEFKSNSSATVMEVVVSKTNSCFRVDFDAEDPFWEIVKLVKEHLSQIWITCKEASYDGKHPLNKLLSPVLNLENSNFGLWTKFLRNYVRRTFQHEIEALLSVFVD